MTSASHLSDAARRQLLPTGVLRLAVNVANAEMARELGPGEYDGKAIDLSKRLSSDWRIEVEIRPFASGGAILAAMREWDAAILAVEASRRDRIAFLPPFATVDATLATTVASPISRCSEADRAAIRIAVVRGAAYTARLEEDFGRCELVSFDAPAAARAAMLSGRCDFVAGIRSTLEGMARAEPSVRLLDDDFLRVPQSLAIALEKTDAFKALSAWMKR